MRLHSEIDFANGVNDHHQARRGEARVARVPYLGWQRPPRCESLEMLPNQRIQLRFQVVKVEQRKSKYFRVVHVISIVTLQEHVEGHWLLFILHLERSFVVKIHVTIQ